MGIEPRRTTQTPEAAEARRKRLQAELERLRALLAADPRVRRLVVFGSFAMGETHEWSDLDVAVVMDTDARFSERALEIRRRLRPTVGMDILVYTPAELRRVQQRPFVRLELLGKGKVVPVRPVEEAREWLAFAEDDLRMARLALGEGIDNQVCFHAQQCAEKCFKALLTREGALVPRTHRIVDLWELLPDAIRAQFADLQDALQELDDYYAATRYPDALPGTRAESLPDRAQAERALQVAEATWHTTRRLISSAGG
jgi:HEPN domain-containing protein/predicted nucleotidyltransferase